MKIQARDCAAFCRSPDTRLRGALLHGPDAGLIAEHRQKLVFALTEGDDLRLSRLESAEVRKSPDELEAALKTRGFFPGRRVVLVETARDGVSQAVKGVIDGLTEDDAFLVLEANALPARSALRKLAEGAKTLASLAIYPAPPNAAELKELLASAGLRDGVSTDGEELLMGIAMEIDRGALLQFIEMLGLYAIGRPGPLDAHEIGALSPSSDEAGTDRLVEAAANGQTALVAQLLRRLGTGSGVPTQVLLTAGRHFRQLLQLAAAPDGVEAALSRMRPPVFGPRRHLLARQAGGWGSPKLEQALRLVQQAEATLRRQGDRPDLALAERCLIRLSMMAGTRRR